MVFGIGSGKKPDHAPDEGNKDPNVIQVYSKDIKVYPHENRWAGQGRILNDVSKTMQARAAATRGGLHSGGLPSGMILSSISPTLGFAKGFSETASRASARGRVKHATSNKPELQADTCIETVNSIKAMFEDETVIEGAYNLEYLRGLSRGANKRLTDMIGTEFKSDLANGNLSVKRLTEVAKAKEKLVYDVGQINVLVDIEAKKGKFELEIAHINNDIALNPNVEKQASMKASLKAMGKVYTQMFKKDEDKEITDDSEWSIKPETKLTNPVKAMRYVIEIGDKDDKKNGINIFEHMQKFESDVKRNLNDTINYVFKDLTQESKQTFWQKFADKNVELQLSESFLKDFYA